MELAYIEFNRGNYHPAFSLFNTVQQYTKAKDCLDKIDKHEMKATFFAEKGRSEKALKWLYMQREIEVAHAIQNGNFAEVDRIQ